MKCSLVLRNEATGKADRHALPPDKLHAFCTKKIAEARSAAAKKGKQHAADSPGEDDPEGSGMAPSPLVVPLLSNLTLESGGSSAANTPADSPIFPQAALSEHPRNPRSASNTSAGKSASKHCIAAPVQLLTGFHVEASKLKLLNPGHRQVSRSRSDTSTASDDGRNTARIAALEKRMDALEKRQDEFEAVVRDLIEKLERLCS